MFEQLAGDNTKIVEVILNDQKVRATEGMTVAALVLSQGLRATRSTPISGSKRAPFCMMGVCYECLMVIDGKANQRSCATIIKNGMRIEFQQGVGRALEDVS